MAKLRFHQITAAAPLLLLLCSYAGVMFTAHARDNSSSATVGYLPAAAVEYRAVFEASAGDGQVAGEEPFQLCLTCRCCAADDPNACLSMPCCFGIDCGLPNKPYGVCAFAPMSCNCSSCT